MAHRKEGFGQGATGRVLAALTRGWCLLVWILGPGYCLAAGSALAAPFIPNDDAMVLERLPVPGDPRTRELRQLRKTLAEDSENLELALEVARRYLEVGRAESDPRYHGYAQAALRPWWQQTEPPPKVLVLRAVLHQARHDFDAALKDLSQVLKIQPTNAQAWLTRAVILEVRGNYAGALRDCLPLLRLHNTLVATGCISSAASLSGQGEQSYQWLLQAVENGSSANPQDQLWALTVLAEIAVRLGRDHDAEQHFQQALSLGLRNTYLLGAYCDFLLDQGRPAEVQALLQGDIRADGLLLRLALAEQQLNAPQLQQHVESLRTRFSENRLRGGTRHLRLEARFALHLLKDPQQALELARENWAVQREPWDARILLEAALQTHDSAAAQPVLDWLESVRLEDIQLKRLAAQ